MQWLLRWSLSFRLMKSYLQTLFHSILIPDTNHTPNPGQNPEPTPSLSTNPDRAPKLIFVVAVKCFETKDQEWKCRKSLAPPLRCNRKMNFGKRTFNFVEEFLIFIKGKIQRWILLSKVKRVTFNSVQSKISYLLLWREYIMVRKIEQGICG